jgi:hypothetical protein
VISVVASRVLVFFYVVLALMWLHTIAMARIRRRQEPLAAEVLADWLRTRCRRVGFARRLTPVSHRRPERSAVYTKSVFAPTSPIGLDVGCALYKVA